MGGVPPQQAETPSRWETTTLETEVGRLRSKVREVEEEQAAVRERERDLEAELVRQRRDADGLREALVAARESSRQRAGEDGRARAEDVKVLQMQVGSLQKLIGEKDALLSQTKAKGREQVATLSERIKDIEEILKDRVATKNGRIVDLNKQLLDCNAEVESLRQENSNLRENLTQTTSRLNATTAKLCKAEEGVADVKALADEAKTLRVRNGELERERASAASELSARPPHIRTPEMAQPRVGGVQRTGHKQPVVLSHGVSTSHGMLSNTPQVAALQVDSEDPPSGDTGDVQQSSRPVLYRPQARLPTAYQASPGKPRAVVTQQMAGWGGYAQPYQQSPFRYL
mmetsp:Transcript_62812/g.143953  ORF Transcript_62812/g.143953 Transcript_62812/m.143953 type:complete len:344 (+) Transcript_62812:3-1034(+)